MSTFPAPSSPQDQTLLLALSGDGIGLEAAVLPSGLRGLCPLEGDGDGFLALGEALGREGLTASAFAAFSRAAALAPGALARIAPYRAMVGLSRRLGLAALASGLERRIARLEGTVSSHALAPPELSRGAFSVIARAPDPGYFGELLASAPPSPLADDPLRDPGLARELFANPALVAIAGAVEDLSFLVVDDHGVPVLHVECDVRGDQHLGCRETGITAFPLGDGAPPDAGTLAWEQLCALGRWAGCGQILMEREQQPAGPAEEVRHAWIDLDQSLDAIEMSYRQTTRQAVRWGRDALDVAPPDDLLTTYQEIHDKAGRRPGLPPDLLLNLVAEGKVHALAGYRNAEAVGLVLSSDHGTTTYDMATVRLGATRDPLSHILIHEAIAAARARGQARFHFGLLHQSSSANAKLRGIATFKAGFASSFAPAWLEKVSVA